MTDIKGDAPEKMLQELHALVGQESAEAKSKIEKLEKAIVAQEAKNQEIVLKHQEATKQADELKEAMAEMEKKLCRMPASDDGYEAVKKQYEEAKSFVCSESEMHEKKKLSHKFQGAHGYLQLKTLRTDIGPDGGFLLKPATIDTMLDRNLTEICPMRSLARVRSGSTDKFVTMLRSENLTAQNRAQTETTIASQPVYERREITSYAITAEVGLSIETLNDTMFNMESELFQDMNEDFMRLEGVNFMVGDGVSKSRGVLVDPSIAVVPSASAASIEWDDLVDLMNIKAGYMGRAVFMFNRSTFLTLMKIKDGEGRPLWQPRVDAQTPATILGRPYVICQDMPDIATGNKAVIFGDFSSGYTIYDRMGMELVRDPVTRASDRIVRFIGHKFVGGMPTKPEAFNILQIS